jgi:tRNA G18 (ribose-2'-O)-methylase SpoU
MRKLSLEELNRLDLPAYHSAPKLPVTLFLDNIRSLHNVGSAFRTADAFRVRQLLLCGITGSPPHREIEKTALGATASVSWAYHEKIEAALENLDSSNIHLVAVEQADRSTSLIDWSVPQNKQIGLVFGNEVFGVSQQVMDRADEVIEIPQFGTKHSFNVSVSMGIVLWEVARNFISQGFYA